MLRKTIIFSLFMVVTGFALLGWVFVEQRRQERIEKDRQRRLETKVGQLTEMVEKEADIRSFENVVSGDGHQERKMHNETKELLVTLSNVLTLSGGSILCVCLLFGTSRLIAKGIGRLARSKAQSREITAQKKQVEKGAEQDRRENSGVLVNSGWSNVTGYKTGKINSEKSIGNYPKETSKSLKERTKGLSAAQAGGDSEINDSSVRGVDTSLLLCDDEDAPFESDTGTRTQTFGEFPAENGLNKDSAQPDDTISTQTRDIENQMAKLEQMASGRTRAEDSKPLQDSLMELTQQVSAIREYASHQQERVQKLQDGYDWSIIKNFCLRIIRCIDNVEDRIRDQSSQQADTRELGEVRDELVFALESTGVEQFKPEINSDYRGQEKNTEAVKDKQECEDPQLSGSIAEVVRPGYWYCVDEDNMKIVRAAQVKLYG